MPASWPWVAVGPIDLDGVGDPVAVAAARAQEAASLGAGLLAFGPLVDGARHVDEFAFAAAVAARGCGIAIGVAVEPGRGRSASIMARELTALDQLAPDGCGLLLAGPSSAHLEEAAAVIVALLGGGPATVTGAYERIEEAPNLPAAATPGGPGVLVLSAASGPAPDGILRAGPGQAVELIEISTDDFLSGRWDLAAADGPALLARRDSAAVGITDSWLSTAP